MTTAEAWAKAGRDEAAAEAKNLLLPSGITVKARRPGVAFLAAHGRLPLGLAKRAEGEPSGGGSVAVLEELVFFGTLVAHCVVSPEISTEPGPGRINPGNIPDDDIKFLIAWAMRGEEAERLATFRGGRTMETLVLAAKEFGQRPSAMLAIEDEVLALNFDLAALAVVWRMRSTSSET